MGEDTWLDLAVVGTEEFMILGAMNASRILRPYSPFTGMF